MGAVSAADGQDLSLDPGATQSQITDQVKDFMPGRFIGPHVGVPISVARDDDRIVQRATLGQAGRLERFDFGGEPVGAGAGDLAADALRSERAADEAIGYRGLGNGEGGESAQTGGGGEEELAGVLFTPTGGGEAEDGGGHPLGADAGRRDGGAPRQGGAIEDWHFGPVDVELDIINLHEQEGGQQVLDGAHARRSLPQRGAARGVDDERGARGNRDRAANEAPAGAGGGWAEFDRGGRAGVEAEALHRDRLSQSVSVGHNAGAL